MIVASHDADASREPRSGLPAIQTLLCSGAVGLLVGLFCLPFLNTIYWLGDEGLYTGAVDRLASGGRLYRDVFEVVPPLSLLTARLWLAMVAPTIVHLRVLSMLIASVTAALTFDTCRRLSGSALMSAFAVLICALLSQGVGIEFGHHRLTTLLGSVSLNAALRARSRPGLAALSGLAAGAALMTTTNRGLLIVAAGTIAQCLGRDRRSIAAYGLAVTILPIAGIAYLLATGTLAAAFDDLVVFAVTRYSGVQGVAFGHGVDAQNWPLAYLMPVTIGLTVIVAVTARDRIRRDIGYQIASAYLVAASLGCFPRPDIDHIMLNVPLALPALLTVYGRVKLPRIVAMALLAVAAVVLPPAVASYANAVRTIHDLPTVRSHAGPIRFIDPQGAPALLRSLAALPSDDPILFYPYSPLTAFLSGHPQTGPIDEFVPGYTTRSQYRDSCIATMDRARWVVVDRDWLDDGFVKRLFPGITAPQPPERVAFERAIDIGFVPVASYGRYELRRRSVPTPSLCAAITDTAPRASPAT